MPEHASGVEVLHRRFPPTGTIPNNPALPVVILRGAFTPVPPDEICERFERNGWTGTWVSTVFDYHHYHPDAHEALAVASGRAEIQLGGPDGEVFAVVPGDCLVLPAGTGHCCLSASADFRVCGAYPAGQEAYTTRRAGAHAAQDADIISRVALPVSDPVFGKGGATVRAWWG